MTKLVKYNSLEYNLLLEIDKVDKWISLCIENYIYEWKEEKFEDGSLKYRYLTRFNLKDGEFKEWYLNGQIKIHCYYVNERLCGEYKEWNSLGLLIKQYYCKEGFF